MSISASTEIVEAIEKGRSAMSAYMYRTGKKSLNHLADDLAVAVERLIDAIQNDI